MGKITQNNRIFQIQGDHRFILNPPPIQSPTDLSRHTLLLPASSAK